MIENKKVLYYVIGGWFLLGGLACIFRGKVVGHKAAGIFFISLYVCC